MPHSPSTSDRPEPLVQRIRRHIEQLGHGPLVEVELKVMVDLLGVRIERQGLGFPWRPPDVHALGAHPG